MESVVPIAVNGGGPGGIFPAFLDCIINGKTQDCKNITRHNAGWLYPDCIELDKFIWNTEFVWAFEDEAIVCRI